MGIGRTSPRLCLLVRAGSGQTASGPSREDLWCAWWWVVVAATPNYLRLASPNRGKYPRVALLTTQDSVGRAGVHNASEKFWHARACWPARTSLRRARQPARGVPASHGAAARADNSTLAPTPGAGLAAEKNVVKCHMCIREATARQALTICLAQPVRSARRLHSRVCDASGRSVGTEVQGGALDA